jgi:acylphosphatase
VPERETTADRQRLNAMVRGRVQGVGFRYFVKRRAGELGLVGFARNLGDGASVEVVAEGSRPALEALLASLRLGPRLSHVEKVEAGWAEASGGFQGFETI